MFALIFGGSGSGKSEYAEKLSCELAQKNEKYYRSLFAFGRFLAIFAFHIAGWSSWQLVGLITQRSVVRVYLPQPNIASSKELANFLY